MRDSSVREIRQAVHQCDFARGFGLVLIDEPEQGHGAFAAREPLDFGDCEEPPWDRVNMPCTRSVLARQQRITTLLIEFFSGI
jgi:hypothetical protein